MSSKRGKMVRGTAAMAGLIFVLLSCPALTGCGGDGKQADPAVEGCAPADRWTIWVANQAKGFDAVTVLEAGPGETTPKKLASIGVGRAPHNLAFSPDGRHAWVVNLGEPPAPGTVSVIDTRTFEVVDTIPAHAKSHGIALTPDGKLAWVANVASNDITVIDTATRKAEAPFIPVGAGPALVAFVPDGSKAYVSNGNDGTTSVVDVASRTVVKTIPTGMGAMGLVVTPNGRFVFETEGLADRVSVIDTTTDTVVNVLTFDETLKEPHGIALAGDQLLITNRTANSLSFVGLKTLERTASLAVAGRPDIVRQSPDCRLAYLTLRDTPAVAVVSVVKHEVVQTIAFDAGSDLHGLGVLRTAP